MAAPALPLDLINLALLKLFARPISSLDDVNNPAARTGTLVYDQEVNSLLRQVAWNWATLDGVITLTGDAPIVRGGCKLYYYQLPPDCVRILSIGCYDDCDGRAPGFQVRARKILLNPFQRQYVGSNLVSDVPPPSIDILYVSKGVNIEDWDPLFIDTIVYKLAIALCFPVTGNTNMIETLASLYEESLKLAEGVNFQEVPIRWDQPDPIASARANINGGENWGGDYWPRD